MGRPNFLYIGLSKSASTYIYQICREHPEIYVPVIKDIFFFDKEYERGLEWYQDLFKGSDNYKAVGEVSHDYLFDHEACKRIKQDIPDIKLIVCLREPLDWLISKKTYEEGRRMIAPMSFLEFSSSKFAKQEMKLTQNLAKYFEDFKREQILVLFYDELKANPQAFCKKIYSFLQVDTEFLPPSLEKEILPAQNPRIKILAVLAQYFCDFCRDMGWHELLGYLKNQKHLDECLFSNKKSRAVITGSERKKLVDYYREEVLALESLGLDLPEAWRLIYQ